MNRRTFPLILLGLCLSLSTASYAQVGINAPAGVAPTQDLEVYTRNGFLVQQQYTRTTADPAAFTATVSCSNTPSLTALAGTLKDPSGDANYTAGVVYNCSASINNLGNTVKGLEIMFTDLNTDPVNSTVVITDVHGNSQQFSGSTLPGRMVILYTSLVTPDPIASAAGIVIRFQTNSSATAGRGFSLQWRALLVNPTTAPTSIALNNAMQFDVNAGSFKAGHNNTASGNTSTAIGYYNFATGGTATAIGSGNLATGSTSTAMGYGNTASGGASITMGASNTASGYTSTAMGYGNTASGDYSTAMGVSINTNSKKGAFMIGDSDPLVQGTTSSSVTDQLVGRFLNGYYLMTCGDLNPGSSYGTVRTGVQIGRGQNSWASISDSTKKERFRPIDHTDLLSKINAMRLTTWNYKGQHAIRHWGPMAQDFFAAFGHDELGQVGCDTLIYSHDFAGVTFAGVQALIRENEALKARLAQQEARLQQAEQHVRQTNARLEAIEAVLVPRRRVARR